MISYVFVLTHYFHYIYLRTAQLLMKNMHKNTCDDMNRR